MAAEQFTYWLQGFIEITNPKEILESEVKIIKDHLDLVFKKETPIYTPINFNELVKRNPNMMDYNRIC